MTDVALTSPPPKRWQLVEPSALPGFAPAMGLTVVYLSFFLLLPLAVLIVRPWEAGFTHFWSVISNERTVDALKLSFGASFLAACVNAVFGTIAAWVLVRYDFPGKRILDALVDLPFALPTAVAGISLAAIYAPNGIVGAAFPHTQIAYTPLGVLIALTFVGFPFIVRSIQPVLQDLDVDAEEAAATLGAGRLRTIFTVVAPAIMPALLTGFSLAFARAVGEYGSVIFIAGNLPNVSEIAPLLIVIRLEEFDYAGAAAVGPAHARRFVRHSARAQLLQSLIARRGRA